MKLTTLLAAACLVLTACATPYSPPVLVAKSPSFQGVVDLLSPERPLDVLLVHGMCTHGVDWAKGAMSELVGAMNANVELQPREAAALMATPAGAPAVQLVTADAVIAGSKLRMTGIVWSPLTAQLKQQLVYDNTGEPTDCATDTICKPKRAKLNGLLKDQLLNDCLSDAMAYQGDSKRVIRQAMVDAFNRALAGAPQNARIVLISDSLGSKLSFDALSQMLMPADPSETKAAVSRLGQIFMNANQLPLLGLADQTIPKPAAPEAAGLLDATKAKPALASPDSLQQFLRARGESDAKVNAAMPSLAIVAFTDPNDLLSYRLRPSAYERPGVAVSDVLVSNEKTILGLIERPDTAHTSYMTNAEVARAIACGIPKSMRCR